MSLYEQEYLAMILLKKKYKTGSQIESYAALPQMAD
jgi:hypothetical protein